MSPRRVRLVAALLGLSALACESTARADVTVSYDRPPPTFGAAPKEVMRQHGDRIRIDSRTPGNAMRPAWTLQKFTRPGQAVRFELSRTDDGRPAALTLMDDLLSAPPRSELRRFTGALETRLGERCRVWQAIRAGSAGHDFVQSGCVTADGVELWRRQASIDAVFATKVVRGPVPAGAVRPPVEVLSLDHWVPRARTEDHSKDYEVVLTAPSGLRMTTRRSGDWIVIEEDLVRGGSRLTIGNVSEGFGLTYLRSPNGQRQLQIRRVTPTRDAVDQQAGVRVADRADDTVFGQVCQWWDMMHGVMDAGRLECRTADGVVLKEERIVRGGGTMWVATKLTRKLQPLEAVERAGRSVLSPSVWGF
jgi:hypothetical protein